MKISIGSDHAGFKAKEILKNHLIEKGIEVEDFGTANKKSVDYPDFAKKVAKSVSENKNKFGVLICGTGIGMSMTANKFSKIRAAKINNEEEAEMAKKHNNANVLTFGARIISTEKMIKSIERFMNSEFEEGRHKRRIDKINKR